MSKNALELFTPKIQAIQKHIDLINTFFRNREYARALEEMMYLIHELDEDDKPRDILDKIIREIKQLKRFVRGSVNYKTRINRHLWIYHDWNDNLQSHIWGCGYFKVEKYLGMSYPSTYKSREAYKSPLLK